MDMREQEKKFWDERRASLLRGEQLDQLMKEKLSIKDRLAVRGRANAGENLLKVLSEYGVEL